MISTYLERMAINDINVHTMAKILLTSAHYRMGGVGDFYVWLKNGPGKDATKHTSAAASLWKETLSETEFTIKLEECISDALISLPRSEGKPGFLRLTRVINAFPSLIDEIEAGKKSFGDCWSVNWGGAIRPTAAEYSFQCKKGQTCYYITADIDEDVVDWEKTLSLTIGWGNFETEIRLLPGSEVDVVLLEDIDGNSMSPVPPPSFR